MPKNKIYDVVGSLCENSDKFAIQRELPEIEGDLIIIHTTGAHGHSMGYNHNGRLRHQEIIAVYEDGTVQQIRRNETPVDLFATLTYPELHENVDKLEK